ncbi:transmembrane emp24 domain-containing protein [Anaeramoeba flamelloides]|uniref:Transmembrane emp24 domain-containing protein n=1 Tax=Anaeramoeba flamelloides TaxID=1746091 RepID=A0ABQ8Y073_9EUKA|nr:transmembrane emp24 domain-containing protein [Anaeramoeba flamelloides]
MPENLRFVLKLMETIAFVFTQERFKSHKVYSNLYFISDPLPFFSNFNMTYLLGGFQWRRISFKPLFKFLFTSSYSSSSSSSSYSSSYSSSSYSSSTFSLLPQIKLKAHEQRVEFKIQQGSDAFDYSNMATVEHLNPLETEIRKTEDIIEEIFEEILYSKGREEAMRNINGKISNFFFI